MPDFGVIAGHWNRLSDAAGISWGVVDVITDRSAERAQSSTCSMVVTDAIPRRSCSPRAMLEPVGRPTSRPELLAAAEQEFDRLWDTVEAVPPSDREEPGACDSWSVKDILAHLDAWNRMWLRWEQAGARGEPTPMPAEGFTWAQTPSLNEQIHADMAGEPWDVVCGRLRDSHSRVVTVLIGYSDADLFAKKRYRWTGSTSVGSYAVSATSSHYAWASGLVRRWRRRSCP